MMAEEAPQASGLEPRGGGGAELHAGGGGGAQAEGTEELSGRNNVELVVRFLVTGRFTQQTLRAALSAAEAAAADTLVKC